MLTKRRTLTALFLLTVINAIADSGQEQDLRLLWKYAAGGELTSRPAVSADGRVYLYAEDRHIHALDRRGRFLWKYRLSGRPADSLSVSPDGSIYACSEDGILYAINPSGRQLWKFNTGGTPAGDPSVSSDGTIYIAITSGVLYAVSHTGRLRWKIDTGLALSQAPVVDSGTAVYLFSGGEIISCSPWGTENWRYKSDEKAGDGGRAAVIHRNTLYSSMGYVLEAVDSDGVRLWSRELYEPNSSIIMYKNGICGISPAGRARGFNMDGEILWESDLSGFRGCPASSEQEIYVLMGDNGVSALSFDGELKTQITGEGFLTQPALTDGMLIAGSGEWIIYAFSASAPDTSLWSQQGRDASHGGRTGENLFVFDEKIYLGNLDYVYLKIMLDSTNVSDRDAALSEIAQRIEDNPGGVGLSYMLPLLYRALGEGRLQVFRTRPRAAGSDFPTMRSEAARLIGRIGNFESVLILAKVLEQENDETVAAAIIDALGNLGTNNQNISLQSVYNKVKKSAGRRGDDRTAASAVKAVEKISAYSGNIRSGLGYLTLLEIYSGNYSKNIRESAKNVLESMK